MDGASRDSSAGRTDGSNDSGAGGANGSSDSGAGDGDADASSAGEASASEPGTQGGPCYPNATCNSGLMCSSNICVPFDSGAGGLGGAGGNAGASGSGGSGVDAGDAAPCLPAPPSLVAFWPGDGTPENVASGAFDGIWSGTPSYAVGEVNQGFYFVSAAHVVTPSYPAVAIAGSMTIAAWVNAFNWGGRIVDKVTVATPDGYLLDTYSGRLRMMVGSAWDTTAELLPFAGGGFVFVAGVYEVTDGTIKLYVDGALRAGAVGATGAIVQNTTLPVRIGANSAGGENFQGIIDEPMIFSRALSAAEVRSIYDAGPNGVCH